MEVFEDVELLERIRTSKVPVFATSSHTSKTLYQANLNQPIAWLFGHEGQGVSSELMAFATATITIPQSSKIESLNVAASAAVCFFEQLRQSSTQI